MISFVSCIKNQTSNKIFYANPK